MTLQFHTYSSCYDRIGKKIPCSYEKFYNESLNMNNGDLTRVEAFIKSVARLEMS